MGFIFGSFSLLLKQSLLQVVGFGVGKNGYLNTGPNRAFGAPGFDMF